MNWDTRTLIIDNFDSFTWNLVQLLESLGDDPIVLRAGSPELERLQETLPRRLILSPGPGTPKAATSNQRAIASAHEHIPILGVCLGHQSIAHFFGLTVEQTDTPIHGRTSHITHCETDLFQRVESPFTAMRYHSLAIRIQEDTSPLRITAWCETNTTRVPMAFKHRTRPIAGVQFHPESFMTDYGATIMENFLSWT